MKKYIFAIIMGILICFSGCSDASWENNFKISNISDTKWPDGTVTINGKITNTTNQNFSSVTIIIEFRNGDKTWTETAGAYDVYTNTPATFMINVEEQYDTFSVINVLTH